MLAVAPESLGIRILESGLYIKAYRLDSRTRKAIEFDMRALEFTFEARPPRHGTEHVCFLAVFRGPTTFVHLDARLDIHVEVEKAYLVNDTGAGTGPLVEIYAQQIIRFAITVFPPIEGIDIYGLRHIRRRQIRGIKKFVSLIGVIFKIIILARHHIPENVDQQISARQRDGAHEQGVADSLPAL